MLNVVAMNYLQVEIIVLRILCRFDRVRYNAMLGIKVFNSHKRKRGFLFEAGRVIVCYSCL